MYAGLLILVASLADWLVGDPPKLPHLVRLMGWGIEYLEPRLRALERRGISLTAAGALLALALPLAAWLAAWLLLYAAFWLWPPLGWLLAFLLTFQTLAAGQLYREARLVLKALHAQDLPLAKSRLAMIVGRDTTQLDEAGVRRAVVETLAESLNDGVVAPLFYLALGGPALAVAYKAVNTLDSMVGYQNDTYREFGKASARLDDAAGWIPARLTALLICGAAPLLKMPAKDAWQVMLKCHALHKSPNSGWPESAAAGALGVRLGGPNHYSGRLVVKPWINENGGEADQNQAQGMLRIALAVSLAASVLAAAAALFNPLWPA